MAEVDSSDTKTTLTLGVTTIEPGRESSRASRAMSRYVVFEEVGRGAMGSVLRAYDPKLEREVALKVLHRDVLGGEATRRLVAEARAMAKLSHPNVVAVYDVEEHHGEVVLVMEYVPGTTLRQWLNESTREWMEIVQRFIAAGRGLAAAHEAGLLHRDFKPANVLVSRAATKVTDFGLAKGVGTFSERPSVETGAWDDSQDALTRSGTVLGTPRYMAPEQHDARELTTASDQYSLCVALWEALSGEPPFSGKEAVDDKRRGPPAWTPSAVPRPIVEAMLRGLSPDPARRWPSMHALLDALGYDPARRRNRWLVGLGTLCAASVGAMGLTSWAGAEAQRCSGAREHLAGVWDNDRRSEVRGAIVAVDAPFATSVAIRTEEVLDHYADEWASMHTEACEATAVRREQSEAMMDLRIGCLHRAKLELRAAVGVLATADPRVAQNAHEVTGALEPLSRCADIEALQAEVEAPMPAEADAVSALRARLAEASAETSAGRYDQAQAKLDAARDAIAAVDYGPVKARWAYVEGELLNRRGEYDAAVESFERAVELGARTRQWEIAGSASGRLLYVVGYRQARPADAMRYLPLARGTSTQGRGEASLLSSLASVLQAQGKYEDAEAAHRKAIALWESALGSEHPHVAATRNNLANALYAQGKHEEAEAEHRRALSAWENALGSEHPRVAASLNNLAGALFAQGKYEDSEEVLRRALRMREARLGPAHPDVAESRNNLASLLLAQGKLEAAAEELRRAIALFEEKVGPEHPDVAQSRNNLANVLHAQGKDEEAEAEQRAALTLREKALGSEHPSVAESNHNLANILHALGKTEEAEVRYRRSIAVWEEALGPEYPSVAVSRSDLAGLLLERGEADEALQLAEHGWTTIRERANFQPGLRGSVAFVLARALWTKHHDLPGRLRAREMAEAAVMAYRDAGAQTEVAEVNTWLETHLAP